MFLRLVLAGCLLVGTWNAMAQIVLYFGTHNRLYATVLAAKSANISMFIIYEIKDNYCFITSFGLE
jgi:hypothetical protein